MSTVADDLLVAAVPENCLRAEDGRIFPMHVERWFSDPEPEEEAALAMALSPVLDVGCGPGRHVAALCGQGMFALGLDVAPSAIEAVQSRGAPAHQGSIFDPVPGEGSWGSALLLDGNIGIGGDPIALLSRIRELLSPLGRVLLEVDPPGRGSGRAIVRAESGDDRSDWFPWAFVEAKDVSGLAEATGFAPASVWEGGGRWFARLDAI